MCFFPKSEEQLHEQIWKTLDARGVVVTSGEIKCFQQDYAYRAELVYTKQGSCQVTTVSGYGTTKAKALASLRQIIRARYFL